MLPGMERGMTEESITATEKIPSAPRCVSQCGGAEACCIPELAICDSCLTKTLIQALSWTYDRVLSIDIECLSLLDMRSVTACLAQER